MGAFRSRNFSGRSSARALDRLVSYPWPGNGRELENVIERLALKELHLQRRARLAELVEKERAPFGGPKKTLFVGVGAGMDTFYISEELALEEGLGQSVTAHREKRSVAPGDL